MAFKMIVFIEIYNAAGQLVTNMKKAVIPNTRNRITWDGSAADGSEVSKGLYFILIKDKYGAVYRKMKA